MLEISLYKWSDVDALAPPLIRITPLYMPGTCVYNDVLGLVGGEVATRVKAERVSKPSIPVARFVNVSGKNHSRAILKNCLADFMIAVVTGGVG